MGQMKPTTKIEWHNERRKIDDLIPFSHNPRAITDKQREDLKKSLEKFDLAEIPVINTDNMILAGHQRLKILQLLGRGKEEIDVRVPNRLLSEAEAKEYNIRSNKNTGYFDDSILAEHFQAEELKEWGFESDELDKIFKDDRPEADDVPEPRKETDIKLGDLFQLGDHRLLCGDATKKEDVERLMDGQKADMVFTDPPYNVDYTGGMGTYKKHEREGIMNDKMSEDSFYLFLRDCCENIVNYCNGGIYICMGSKYLDKLKLAFEEMGGHWQTYIIWAKNNFTLSRADYQHIYEPILYGWNSKTQKHYFIQDRDAVNLWEDIKKIKTEFDGEYTTISFQGFKVKIKGKAEGEVIKKKQKVDIWRYDKPTRSLEHPTMKPVSLCLEAIKNSSERENIVLDLFGGSGSTLIACEQLNRKCFMMELDEKYCQVIIDRWEKFTGNKAKKI